MRIGKTKPFVIRNDRLAVLGKDAAKNYNLADIAAQKTIVSVKSARKTTPSQRLEQLLKEHKRKNATSKTPLPGNDAYVRGQISRRKGRQPKQ